MKILALKHASFVLRSVLITESQKNNRILICEEANAITTLAMMNQDVVHISVEYSGHVNWISVEASSVHERSRTSMKRPSLILCANHVRLKEKDALEQLKTIKDKLIELIADEKDKVAGGS
ncbi:MAG: hypothetical protein ACJAS1_006071 [Oleiphilaceae bacterium]|jgi:hypothetical protein